MFTLDSEIGELAVVNPEERFCVDLTGVWSTWAANRHYRKRAGRFRLSCDVLSVSTALRVCRACHRERLGGALPLERLERLGRETQDHGWITERLITMLERLSKDPNTSLSIHTFELWTADTSPELAALSVGFAVGCVFHDLTAGTPLWSQEGAGSILIRAVGLTLANAGFTLWYWGIEVPYMRAYDNAVSLSRLAFLKKWQQQLQTGEIEHCEPSTKSFTASKTESDHQWVWLPQGHCRLADSEQLTTHRMQRAAGLLQLDGSCPKRSLLSSLGQQNGVAASSGDIHSPEELRSVYKRRPAVGVFSKAGDSVLLV